MLLMNQGGSDHRFAGIYLSTPSYIKKLVSGWGMIFNDPSSLRETVEQGG
jgi:hypothetical protein